MAKDAAKVEQPVKPPTISERAQPRRPLLFLLLSLVFHLLLTVSVFDIYFTSPVVHPSRRFSLADTYDGSKAGLPPPPADRLVLIVGDGLRADTLYKEHPPEMAAMTPAGSATSEPFSAAPHLLDICLRRGAWGVSHTRVPTESRPGHVALIAGMYEDVSAVTKGWKLNPVNFDSLMNVSTHAYTFGSPDILPMFAAGASEGRVDMWSYHEGDEDFTKDATHLDLWVLDQVTQLFARAKKDENLARELHRPGVVFFLHLLGLDTTGHTYRPHSPEYVGNLAVVDGIVRRVEELFADFYRGDNDRTAWIFSADHGMSTKGNHGDGDPDNTRTPLVAWGSGVRGPRPADEAQMDSRQKEAEKDTYYSGWRGLESLWRQDVDQADITALMATLLGLPLPANSEGVLPLDYLDLDAEQSARAMFANALEILEIYRVKHEQRRARTIRYVPFSKLPPVGDAAPGSMQVNGIRTLIAAEHYTEAVAACQRLIKLSLEGANYLQTYDWLLLVTVVALGYIGSVLYGFAFLLRNYVLETSATKEVRSRSGLTIVVSMVIALCARFAAERAPVTYYLYVVMTGLYWSWVIEERHILVRGISPRSSRSLIPLAVYAIAALELIALGYNVRLAWTLGFFFLGFVWPFLTLDDVARSKNEGTILLWGICCIGSGLFCLSDVDKQESRMLLALTGVVVAAAGLAVSSKPEWFLGGPTAPRAQRVIQGQVVLTVATTCVTLSSSWHLENKLGLPLINQALAWLFLLTSMTLPFALGFRRGQPTAQRLAIIIFASAPAFILLSMRDEALFFLCFTATILVWAKMEGIVLEERFIAERKAGKAKPSLPRPLNLYDVFPSLTLLFLLHAAFFGTGNVASISSFYLKPVYRLVPVFSPFLMAALLIAKILVPFVVLASVLQVVCKRKVSKRVTHPETAYIEPGRSKASIELEGPPLLGPNSVGGLHLISSSSVPLLLASSLCADLLALHFLFHVKNQGGSWLEIGQSITHFVMANLLQ